MKRIALISLYGIENNGIRSISSLLKREYFDTYLIFFKRWLNNDIRLPTEKERAILTSLLKALKVDMVGISFTSPFFKIARDITQHIKSVLDVAVVWGGIHATVKPEECLRYADIICRGEGEYAMLDLAKAYLNGSRLENIKNICYKQENRMISEEMRPLIQDLDLLPSQDYGDKNKFYIDGKKLLNIDPLVKARELRIFASRGCPFNCSYCYNSVFRKLYGNENYHRIKSVESVISEIECALTKLKTLRKIDFDDDVFIFPKDWILEFCKKYKSRIGLPFEILFNAECMDKETLKNLKSAGLRRVQVGIQTGSKKESEEIYNRRLPLEKIQRFADVSKSLKLDVVYDVILDNPLASFEEKKELIDLLLTLPRPFNLFFYSLTIFPGTEISEFFLSKGLVKPEGIEGEASKSFYQFRLSFSYPREKDELFIVCIVSLTSKSFIPKFLISLLKESNLLRKHPLILKWFAQFSNQIKLLHVLTRMSIQGELGIWKFKEYGLPKRFLIQ